jgi:hypothetical protein
MELEKERKRKTGAEMCLFEFEAGVERFDEMR